MQRSDLFAAIRPFAPDGRFLPSHVQTIDALADAFGLPREGDNGLAKAVTLIKQFEGVRLTAYPDLGSGGDPWTVGFGSTGSDIKRGTVWTMEQAEARLTSDVAKFASGVDKLIGGHATTNQRAALISFAYNTGLQALKESTLLRLHNEGDAQGAAAQFGKWVKASEKTLPGLVTRRAAEAKLYLAS